jgi:hypothetical protein
MLARMHAQLAHDILSVPIYGNNFLRILNPPLETLTAEKALCNMRVVKILRLTF